MLELTPPLAVVRLTESLAVMAPTWMFLRPVKLKSVSPPVICSRYWVVPSSVMRMVWPAPPPMAMVLVAPAARKLLMARLRSTVSLAT
ncbi:hypothetical protein D3C71_1872880 [compost metagenome]